MKNNLVIQLQIALNKRMYDQKKISYEMYSKVNEKLHIQLTILTDNNIISYSEMQNTGGCG